MMKYWEILEDFARPVCQHDFFYDLNNFALLFFSKESSLFLFVMIGLRSLHLINKNGLNSVKTIVTYYHTF